MPKYKKGDKVITFGDGEFWYIINPIYTRGEQVYAATMLAKDGSVGELVTFLHEHDLMSLVLLQQIVKRVIETR